MPILPIQVREVGPSPVSIVSFSHDTCLYDNVFIVGECVDKNFPASYLLKIGLYAIPSVMALLTSYYRLILIIRRCWMTGTDT